MVLVKKNKIYIIKKEKYDLSVKVKKKKKSDLSINVPIM